MVNSKNPLDVLRAFLKQHPHPHYAIGLSSGMDSVALARALFLCQKENSFQVTAIHVHHGLSPNADDWLEQAKQFAKAHHFAFQSARVGLKNRSENAARQARFTAFAKCCAAHQPIFLAQHLNDQAETILLKTFRGGGLKAFGGMHEVHSINSLTLFRPWLKLPRSAILRFAQQENLSWVQDESNFNQQYARNFLRQTILPSIEQRFPNALIQMAQNAQTAQEALLLLNDLARIDLAQAVLSPQVFSWSALRNMSFLRLKNLIRFLIEEHHENVSSFAQLEEFCRQLQESSPQKNPQWRCHTLLFSAHHEKVKIIPR